MKLSPDMLRKLAYVGLILWLGLLAPITYFNVFATDHMVQPYKIAVFETMPRQRQLPAEFLNQQTLIRLKQSLTGQKDVLTARSPFAAFAQQLHSSLSTISLAGGAAAFLLALYFGQSKQYDYLSEASAFIEPLKKPPRFL